MSTPNFKTHHNTSCIFAEMQDAEIDNTVENIQYALQGRGFENENYSNEIASKKIYVTFAGVDIPVGITCTIEYGYHSGFSFDYSLELDGESLEYFPVLADEAAELLEAYIYDNPGFCKMQGRNLANRINRAARGLITEVEDTYRLFTTPLRCIGVFGNGEAVYTEADTFKSCSRGRMNTALWCG